jgi:hypothetical protein
MEAVLKDERFARVATERKFRSVGRKQRRVQIDQRFQAMFSEPRFVSRVSVDKRGRPAASYSSKENFKKYYDLKDSDDEESDSEEEEDGPKKKSDLGGAKKVKRSAELLHKADKKEEEEETSSDDEESIEAKVKVIYFGYFIW